MRFTSSIVAAIALAAPALSWSPPVPSLNVPSCPVKTFFKFNTSAPDGTPFPLTEFRICWGWDGFSIDFYGSDEMTWLFNPNYTTNDPIYQYEAIQVLIAPGTENPATYLELDIAPNNVTYSAIVYNPSFIRWPGQPFDKALLNGPADGIYANTVLEPQFKTWRTYMEIPFSLFNIVGGQGNGTQWRMNFARTVTTPKTFPKQTLGAWSPPDEASIHKSPFFGHVTFV
jgi:hypothetical protein